MDYKPTFSKDISTGEVTNRMLTAEETAERDDNRAVAEAAEIAQAAVDAITGGAQPAFELASPEWYSWSPDQMEAATEVLRQEIVDISDLKSAKVLLLKLLTINSKQSFAIGVLADRMFPGRR